MSLKLTVAHKDGSESRTTITASTEVAFEEHFGKAWGEAFSEPHPRSAYLYFAAWHSIYDDGRTALEFKAWLRTMESFEVEMPEEAHPLDQEAQAG
jgi:hypothetical protein